MELNMKKAITYAEMIDAYENEKLRIIAWLFDVKFLELWSAYWNPNWRT